MGGYRWAGLGVSPLRRSFAQRRTKESKERGEECELELTFSPFPFAASSHHSSVTNYLDDHPGGRAVILAQAGHDATCATTSSRCQQLSCEANHLCFPAVNSSNRSTPLGPSSRSCRPPLSSEPLTPLPPTSFSSATAWERFLRRIEQQRVSPYHLSPRSSTCTRWRPWLSKCSARTRRLTLSMQVGPKTAWVSSALQLRPFPCIRRVSSAFRFCDHPSLSSQSTYLSLF